MCIPLLILRIPFLISKLFFTERFRGHWQAGHFGKKADVYISIIFRSNWDCLLTSGGAKEIGLQGSSPGRKCALTVRIPELLFAPFFHGKELGRGILAEEL